MQMLTKISPVVHVFRRTIITHLKSLIGLNTQYRISIKLKLISLPYLPIVKVPCTPPPPPPVRAKSLPNLSLPNLVECPPPLNPVEKSWPQVRFQYLQNVCSLIHKKPMCPYFSNALFTPASEIIFNH